MNEWIGTNTKKEQPMKEQIEVITYEQERLNYFTNLMNKAQKRYKRLFKKFKDAPYLSAESEMLSDAGRETQFHGDVVEMLEKGYRKVVRCKDCEYRHDPVGCALWYGSCNDNDYFVEHGDDFFCSYGKMKGGAE